MRNAGILIAPPPPPPYPAHIADNWVEYRGSPFNYLSHLFHDVSIFCQVTLLLAGLRFLTLPPPLRRGVSASPFTVLRFCLTTLCHFKISLSITWFCEGSNWLLQQWKWFTIESITLHYRVKFLLCTFPESTMNLMPSIVMEVSAMFVDTTHLRTPSGETSNT